MDWSEFESREPEMAVAGTRLLGHDDGVAIGFLATIGDALHLAPVCPIFCDDAICLSVGAGTPKRRDLERDGRYVLHAFLGPSDEEFQIAGRAVEIVDAESRARVHRAIRFGSFDSSDPLFRLDIERAMWGYWQNAGQPGTRPVRRFFRAAGFGGEAA